MSQEIICPSVPQHTQEVSTFTVGNKKYELVMYCGIHQPQNIYEM